MKTTIAFYFIFPFLLMLSCDNQSKGYRITSMVKGIEVSKGYHFADSGDSVNYYLLHNGKSYLKKEVLFFNDKGYLDSVYVFKAEGIVGYSSEERKSDSLLVRSNGWEITNLVKLKNDSVVLPFKGIVLELDTMGKKIYSLNKSGGHNFLYSMNYL